MKGGPFRRDGAIGHRQRGSKQGCRSGEGRSPGPCGDRIEARQGPEQVYKLFILFPWCWEGIGVPSPGDRDRALGADAQ
eukprot:15003058-Heterocapsa_arctica.AAC.1